MTKFPALRPSPQQLLALRIGEKDYALEPGRDYLLGSDRRCDLRLAGSETLPVHARLRMSGAEATIEPVEHSVVAVNGLAGSAIPLRIGDTVRLGVGAAAQELRVVRDLGAAEILPDPAAQAARAARVRPRPRLPLSQEHAQQRFSDMLAQELQRLPWLGLSLLAHVLLLLLLFWLYPTRSSNDDAEVAHGFQNLEGPANMPAAPPGPPDILVPTSELEQPELREPERPMDKEDDPALLWTADVRPDLDSLLLMANTRLARISGQARGDHEDVLDSAGGASAGDFRAAVTELRRTGFEIVFVFDSTASMASSIAATKANIDEMLQTLRALVPGARFGLVTYRDKGHDEEYVVRELPLDQDFFAAASFMQGVRAAGGGDTPEAVLAGLRAAFGQPFQRGSRRVVVLLGDASPHAPEMTKLLDEVRRFTRTGRSCVHTLLTNRPRGPDPRAVAAFQRISRCGNGISIRARDHGRILQQVLTMAFGRQFEGNLANVREQLTNSRRSPPTWALDLARRGGPELAAVLRQRPVPDPLIHALLRRLRSSVARELIDLLTLSDLSDSSRNAISHVLQQQLGLPRGPIDPERPAAITRHAASKLLAVANERLDD